MNELLAYYGFTKQPFTREIAPGDLHHHQGHGEAVARIGWVIAERGIGVVTGEVGAGKTVAARAAVATLDPLRHTVIYLPNPAIGAIGIYSTITTTLGGVPKFRKADLMAQATDLLILETVERRRTPVLVIDEAHLLDQHQLEEVRMITNSEMDSRSPLAVLLVGQPALRGQLRLGIHTALNQRVTMRVIVTGMTVDETKSYIGHHLAKAGRTDATIFTDDAIAKIHHVSGGLPRAVNNLARSALTAAFFAKKNIIDTDAAAKAIAEHADADTPTTAP